MTDIHDENDRSSQFDITQDDLDWVAERLGRDGAPQELREIARWLIQRRTEHDSGNGNEQTEEVLLKPGEPILPRLAEALQIDSRFASLEDKWLIADKLPGLEPDALQNVHRMLLQNPSSTLDEILSVLKEQPSTDKTLWRMAVHTALCQSPQRFENVGTPARPQWKARLPEVEQAEVTYYAYDPQTYEILCRPGQRLSQKKAQRLQELNLYAYMVTFAE